MKAYLTRHDKHIRLTGTLCRPDMLQLPVQCLPIAHLQQRYIHSVRATKSPQGCIMQLGETRIMMQWLMLRGGAHHRIEDRFRSQ